MLDFQRKVHWDLLQPTSSVDVTKSHCHLRVLLAASELVMLVLVSVLLYFFLSLKICSNFPTITT